LTAPGIFAKRRPPSRFVENALNSRFVSFHPANVAMNTLKSGVLTAERKLVLAAVLVACVTASLAFVGGLSSWQYYLTVEECQADGPSLVGKRLRVNGTVAPASLKIANGRKSATFDLMGTGPGLGVVCEGPLPDNLAEGIQVVVEGELRRPGWLEGERVMTRCASKYQSGGSGPAQGPPASRHGSAR
jgi:cytochrome c-type biogenesis protein CcmE